MRKKKWIEIIAAAVMAVVCAVSLAACGTKIIPDPAPYTFEDREHVHPPLDADMKIDGKFDEARWESARWLHVQDKPNDVRYADISFTASYGTNGVYFGMKIVEHDSFIYYNPQREVYCNSCIEMYMGPIDRTTGESVGDATKIVEFNFLANGSTSNRVNTNSAFGSSPSWVDKVTVWEKTPISASVVTGGMINDTATGYNVEAYVPFTFLEFCGWDVSDPDNLLLGINPVHIFSYNYTGTDIAQDRFWSDWAKRDGYRDVKWLTPKTYFRFGANGLVGHDLKVTYSGAGEGEVKSRLGTALLSDQSNTVVVKPINNSTLTAITVGGVDYMNRLHAVGGYYEFTLENPTADVSVEVTFS